MKDTFIAAAQLMWKPHDGNNSWNIDGCCIAIEQARSGRGSRESRTFRKMFAPDAVKATGMHIYWMGLPSLRCHSSKHPTRQRRTWALLLAAEAWQDFAPKK